MIVNADSTSKTADTTWRTLIANIVEAYHQSLRAALPGLERLADQVACEQRLPIRILDHLLREFTVLAETLRTHLLQQEGHLFPMIAHGCESTEQTHGECHLGETLDELLSEAAHANNEVLARILRVTACLDRTEELRKDPLVDTLVKGFHELREDLEEHVHLENDVLFPMVRKLLGPEQDAAEDPGMALRASGPALPSVSPREEPAAPGTTHSVLHAVRDHLSVENAIALGARLPTETRRLYYEGWQQRWDPDIRAREEAFLAKLVASLGEEPDSRADENARRVLRILAGRLPPREMQSVGEALPRASGPFRPAEGPVAPLTELIVADQETG